MEISFTKNRDNGHIFSCRRKNGTITWKQGSSFFALHDICHYAVETNLVLRNAFYGMLAGGIDITDFELPAGQRPFELTGEAIFAEHIVNLLGIEFNQGRIDNFNDLLGESLKRNNLLPVIIDSAKLEQIRTDIHELMNKWAHLGEGDSLTLIFNE